MNLNDLKKRTKKLTRMVKSQRMILCLVVMSEHNCGAVVINVIFRHILHTQILLRFACKERSTIINEPYR